MTQQAKFTDNKNRTWNLVIDIPTARKVRNQLGVDILDINKGLPKLAEDPILMCDVLFMLLEEQAARKKITDEEFGRSLTGGPFEAACDAFIESLINFSPPRRRTILQGMQQTALQLESMLTGMVETEIPAAMSSLQAALSGRQSRG